MKNFTLLLKTSLLALAAAASLGSAVAAPATESAGTTVVLVHGAFADGSSWNKVVPLLQAKGLKVVSVQNPLTSLADDVAATKRAIDAQSGKVVLVGHSWGGTVITQAGADSKVSALVYVAAFAPSEGETAEGLGKDYPVPPGIKKLKADADGYLSLPASALAEDFAQDLPAAKTRLMAVSQGPINSKAFGEAVSVAAWKTKPSYYIVAAKDRMIAPSLEAAMAKKIGATTVTLNSSHVVMLSKPAEVAAVIISAAAK
ncbi:MAG: pnaE [Herbaspirillum sp.]|nr:pnaE [Herbaspirillum sp.]